MKKGRILTLLTWFPPRYVGGAEISAFYTVYGLAQRGYDTRVLSICAAFPEPFDRITTYRGLLVHEVGLERTGGRFRQFFDARVFAKVIEELRAYRPDVVHIHNVSGASLAPFLACRALGIPVVLTLHDHWLLCAANMLYQKDGSLCPSTSRNRCCGRCYRRYDHWADIPLRRRAFSLMTAGVSRFVTPSRRLRDLHVARGYDPGRFAVVPYGISGDVPVGSTDEEERSALRSRLRKLMQDGPETVLHFSGVLVETKGLDTLIAAMPLVSSHLGPTQLWVSGRGEDRYVERLERLGTPPVHLLGKLMFNNVREVYGCAGLSLVPSVWYDNSPVVIYESLMAGTPVLGSDLGGIPELIEEGVTGYVVPPRDAEALAAKVIEHFSKPARVRREMRRACREYAAQHFTLDRHVDAISEIYASVLQ